MYSLLKKDYYTHNWVSYFSLAIGLVVFYIIHIPPVFLFTISFLSLLITLFYYDDKNKTNRFFISLPVSKKKFVRSRYVYLACLAIVLLLFQWIVALSIPNSLTIPSNYIYDWRDIIILYAIALVLISVGGFIFYALRSFLLAVSIFLLLYLIGTIALLDPLTNVLDMTEYIYFNEMDQGLVLLAEAYIPFQPFIVTIIVAFALFYISMKLVERIFSKRDL